VTHYQDQQNEKHMRTTLAIIAAALALTACARSGVGSEHTENPNFQPDKLFTVDGCAVYRFSDAGSFRYLTTCPGSASSVVSCGKSCTRYDAINTAIRPPETQQ
jgi:hypothetical protein